VCGCFRDDLIEFENRVKNVYRKENQHYISYMKEIQKVKKLWSEVL